MSKQFWEFEILEFKIFFNIVFGSCCFTATDNKLYTERNLKSQQNCVFTK